MAKTQTLSKRPRDCNIDNVIENTDVNLTNCVANNVKALLFDEATADCVIVTSRKQRRIQSTQDSSNSSPDPTERIPVHKFILELRSPVFKTMLSSAMIESNSNEIIISNFDYGVVKEFVRFLYLDTCDVITCEAKSLLAMAHKYDVKGLFTLVDQYLIGTLNVDTVIDLLQFADLYGATGLKAAALKFINRFTRTLIEDGRLRCLSKELLHDIIFQLVEM